MIINLGHHDYLKNLVLSELPVSENDDFIVNTIFDVVENLYNNQSMSLQEAYSQINDFYKVTFDFVSALKNFDNAMTQIPFTPAWSIDKAKLPYVYNTNLEKIIDEALHKLRDNQKFGDHLLYFQVIVTGLLGGFEGDNVVEYIEFDSYLEPYRALKPKAVAYILQTEYQGVTIKSVPDVDVEPIDVSLYPEYLTMDNPHILYKDGKAYLKIDIMNAMTAAGGFAQALEKQDLEGGVTNAAPKRKDNKSKSTEPDADETPEDATKTS